MFSSFKEKLNTSLSTYQETRSGATSTSTTAGSITGVQVTDDPAQERTSHDSNHSITGTTSSASPTTVPTSVLRQGSIGAIGSSLASRFSAVGGASSSSFFRRPQTATPAAAATTTTTSTSGIAENNRASVDLISLGDPTFVGGRHNRLVALVQQLTLDPREEKADPVRLAKIREEYRPPPPSSSRRPSSAFLSPSTAEDKNKTPSVRSRDNDSILTDFKDDDEEEDAEELYSREDQMSLIDLRDPDVPAVPLSVSPAATSESDHAEGGIGISDEVAEKLEILQRYETRFPDLARAFKKLVQEKMAAERVLKATTALEDMADTEALEAHLQNMSTKNEMSMQEIRRLSEELGVALKAKNAETASHKETIEELKSQISTQLEEIDSLKTDKETLTLQLEQQRLQFQQERISDSDSTKVNSLDLHLTSSPTSPLPSPSPSLISLMDSLKSSTVTVEAEQPIPTSSSPSPPPPASTLTSAHSPTTPTIGNSASTGKEKKPTSKVTKNKDQALRELMVRLEHVLKEKNQAREDQEEAQEQLSLVQSRLEKELEVNQAMIQKMDLLQSQVAEMEEKERRAVTLAKKNTTLENDIVNKNSETDGITTRTSTSFENKNSQDLSSAAAVEDLKQALEKSDQESKEALKIQQEASEALEVLQKEHQSLRESIVRTEQDLKDSQTLVQKLQESIQSMETTERDLVHALETAKQDLVESLEEVKEKQRLLELERTWREEAEASRDGIKREHETRTREMMRDRETEKLQQDQWRQESVQSAEQVQTLKEKIRGLEGDLEVLTQERDQLKESIASSSAVSNDSGQALQQSNEEMTRLEQELKEASAQLEVYVAEKQALESQLQEHESMIDQLKDESSRARLVWTARVHNLETEIQIASKQHEEERSEVKTRLADLKVLEMNQSTRIQELETREAEMMARWEALQERDEMAQKEEVTKNEAVVVKESESVTDQEETAVVVESDESTPHQDESHISGLEELSSLKQERAELSEKLTRLERLHQGFERDSFEKVQSFEQELALLLQQKAALEAQVQEQSDLLIKEKEKEKELEQQRVSEGIERVRLELEAVRTAERFASAKVTELAKDRDQVVEKVIKLEARLEKLRECKVGQEQSLTSKIEELTTERDQLLLELERVKAVTEERTKGDDEAVQRVRQESSELTVTLQSERDRALSDLASRDEETKTEKQASEERIQALTSDLELRSAELSRVQMQFDELRQSTSEEIKTLSEQIQSLAQERDALDQERAAFEIEIQALRQSMAEQIDKLTKQVDALTQERDSLAQQHSTFETQLATSASQADETLQKLAILQKDTDLILTAKTESQEQLADLQSQLRSLTMRERDSKESLNLAKSTIHQRDQDLSAARESVEAAETLLERSRQQISKLEREKQSLSDQVDSLKATMTKTQQDAKSSAAAVQTKHASVTLELQKLKATHVKALQDRDRYLKEKEALTVTVDESKETVKMRQAEMETLQHMQDSTETQLKECQGQLKEARNKVDTLEELTSIAKRVAETKVTELEMLKSESAELERKLSQSKDDRKKEEDEYRRVVKELSLSVEDTERKMGEEILSLRGDLTAKDAEVEALKADKTVKEEETDEMRKRCATSGTEVARLESQVVELLSRERDLELELQHFKDLEELLAREKSAHETAVEESKMRENHLRTVNKTLKEEVRKLQRYLPGASPMPNSPYTQSNPPQTPMQPPAGSSSNGLLGIKGQQLFLNSPGTPRPNVGAGSSNPPIVSPPATPRFKSSSRQPSFGEEGSEVNVEYLKNVLLNFMEHKDRRQQLVPVVAEMLKLSSEETKRFSKVI
ncbi:hypothetical protein BGZ83_001615 [Gryganskiella cystojenkinii]|nr:hypothetical protein BGZ83_001615 [Gryganskiella cystojenkinii]